MTTTVQRGTTGVGISMPQVGAGIAGGLAGGLVFGVMMQAMGMMGMVAQLVGSTSVAVGWLAHLAISAFIGASFTVLGSRLFRRQGSGVVQGLAVGAGYGIVWWVLGPLLLMPARLGMPLFTVDAMAGKSLMGHLVFGMVLGAVCVVLLRRTTAR